MNEIVAGKPAVFFDGGCPLCRREIAHYRRLDALGRILWLDIHAERDLPEKMGLSWQAAMQRIHVADANGGMHVGVPAFLVIWDHLPRYWVVSSLMRRIPGLVRMLDYAYGIFASWRWRRRCSNDVCGS